MSSRARSACLGALFVTCGVLVAIGCSDDSGSKKVRGVGGEAGEAGEPSGGTGAGGNGGSGEVPIAGTGGGLGEAGQGPAQGGSAVVGAAGAPAEGGAPSSSEGGAAGDTSTAGTGPLACVSSGSVTNLSIPEQEQLTVCRGALVTANFNADSTDATFQCCASLGLGTNSSSIVVGGLGNGDGGGQLAFTVPDDAVSGAQSASVTCSGSAAPASLDLDISDASLPVVTGLENSTVDSNSDLVIDGTNLSGVTSVTAVPTTDATSTVACQINPDSSNDSVVTCNFGGEIPSNADYYLVISASNCGDAVVQPTFSVIPSL
jgi:hypothetical protein